MIQTANEALEMIKHFILCKDANAFSNKNLQEAYDFLMRKHNPIKALSNILDKDEKKLFKFVAKHCGKQDVRFYLKSVHVTEDGYMQATDGHTLAQAKTTLSTGFYDAKTGEKLEKVNGVDASKVTFPDFKRAIPTTDLKTSEFIPEQLELKQMNDKLFYYVLPHQVDEQFKNQSYGIDKKLLEKALFKGVAETYQYKHSSCANSIIFESGCDKDIKIVIMPLRVS